MDLAVATGCIIFGFIVGALASRFGIGGAIVTIPFFRAVLGFSGHEAVATALPLTIPTAISGVIAYSKKEAVEYELAVAVGITGSVFSVLGAYFTTYVSSEALMVMTAALFLILAAIIRKQKPIEQEPEPLALPGIIRASLVIGIPAGLISGFFGIGGGAILVPLLVIIGKLPMKAAVPASLLAIAIYAIPGSITHHILGNVQLDVLAFILVGSLAGAYIGAGWAMKTEEKALKNTFAVFLVLMAAILLLNEFLVL